MLGLRGYSIFWKRFDLEFWIYFLLVFVFFQECSSDSWKPLQFWIPVSADQAEGKHFATWNLEHFAGNKKWNFRYSMLVQHPFCCWDLQHKFFSATRLWGFFCLPLTNQRRIFLHQDQQLHDLSTLLKCSPLLTPQLLLRTLLKSTLRFQGKP